LSLAILTTLLRPVSKQNSNTNRPFDWEDEAPAEPRFRRVREGVPPSGRNLPGMPLQMVDPDGDDSYPIAGARFRGARTPWWRPSSTVGRVFLGVCAVLIGGGFVLAGVLLKTYLSRDARFRIAGTEAIEATGLTQVSRAEMLPVFGEDIGRNIFFVNLSDRRKQLEEIPWVERATVMRVLPDQIRVSVVERKPVAFTRQGQQIGLVDASGVLLSMPAATMAQHNYSFPVLTGIDPADPLASRRSRMAVYGRLLAELDANNQHLSQQISEIDLTDPEDARVLMPEQGADILAHFGEDRFLERYQRYKTHIAEWRQQYPRLASVDLRYDQQVVLEMAHGANAIEATPGPDAASNASSAKRSAGAPSNVAKPAPASEDAAPKSTSKPAAAVSTEKTSAPSNDKAARDKGAKDKAAREKAAKAKLIRELTARDKAEKEKKKREAAQHTALSQSKGKSTPTTHPPAASRQGQ
jgi:cell division protein FtsQ